MYELELNTTLHQKRLLKSKYGAFKSCRTALISFFDLFYIFNLITWNWNIWLQWNYFNNVIHTGESHIHGNLQGKNKYKLKWYLWWLHLYFIFVFCSSVSDYNNSKVFSFCLISMPHEYSLSLSLCKILDNILASHLTFGVIKFHKSYEWQE